jgi:hypothetical protein
MKKHIVQCLQKYPYRKPSGFSVPIKTRLFTFLVKGSFLHEYWIYIEVPSNSLLRGVEDSDRSIEIHARNEPPFVECNSC